VGTKGVVVGTKGVVVGTKGVVVGTNGRVPSTVRRGRRKAGLAQPQTSHSVKRAGGTELKHGALLLKHGDLRVMFPLVSGPGELRRAKALFAQARAEVVAAGHPVAADVPVGIMVETPAAVEVADLLAKDCRFFSIGTNDLIQYSLAIDRANQDVAYLYRPMHPAILRMIRRVVEAGKAAGVKVSICGEMAGDPAYTLVLIALGADELSMGGTSIPMVKQIVRSSSLAEARSFLRTAFDQPGDDEIEAFVRTEMRRRYPDVFEEFTAELPDEDAPADEFPVS
jgi:phosphotransferase system enzyme I (PtsI)